MEEVQEYLGTRISRGVLLTNTEVDLKCKLIFPRVKRDDLLISYLQIFGSPVDESHTLSQEEERWMYMTYSKVLCTSRTKYVKKLFHLIENMTLNSDTLLKELER